MRHEGETRISINRALDSAFDHLDEVPPVEADYTSKYIKEWEAYKPERNGIGAILMRNVLKRSLGKRDRGERGQYGMLDYKITKEKVVLPQKEPLQILPRMPETVDVSGYIKAFEVPTAAFIATFTQDTVDYFDPLQDGNGTEIDILLYQRMHVLTYGFFDFSQNRIMTKKNVHHFIGRVLTAGLTYQRSSILSARLLARTQELRPQGKQVASVLRNSYPLIMQLANGHVDYSIDAMNNHLVRKTDGTFIEEEFSLEPVENEQYALHLDKNTWQQYKQTEEKKIKHPEQLIATGCLAMASENKIRRMLGEPELEEDTNVIKDSLNWYADLVEAM